MRLLLNCLVILSITSCSNVIKNKNVIGQTFPVLKADLLSGEEISIPYLAEPSMQILLVGYKQRTQFDIDRWLIGLDMAGAKLQIFEVPVLSKWFPQFLRNKIDGGMKSGIPNQLWKSVATVYDDADVIKNFLGNEKPNNARVILVDAERKILAFFDNGFSSSSLLKLLSLIPKNQRGSCANLF